MEDYKFLGKGCKNIDLQKNYYHMFQYTLS